MKEDVYEERENLHDLEMEALEMLKKNPGIIKYSDKDVIGWHVDVRRKSEVYSFYIADVHEADPKVIGIYRENDMSRRLDSCAKSVTTPIMKVGEAIHRILTF